MQAEAAAAEAAMEVADGSRRREEDAEQARRAALGLAEERDSAAPDKQLPLRKKLLELVLVSVSEDGPAEEQPQVTRQAPPPSVRRLCQEKTTQAWPR